MSAGANVTLSGGVSGTPAPSYQWQKNTVGIAGAANATLTMNSVATAATGSYTLVATNVAGSATSNAAVVTVNGTATPAGWVTAAPGARYLELGGGEGGLRFVVGSAGLTVTEIGFRKGAGTYADATMRIRDGAGVVLASGVVPQAGVAVGGFAYGSLAAPVVLAAGQVYAITFQFASYNGCYVYSSDGEARGDVATTAAATLLGVADVSGGALGVLVDFKYTAAAAAVAR